MSGSEQRVDVRVPCDIEVTLRWGRREARLRAEDVSYRGMFLRTDSPPELRQLVKIECDPHDGRGRLSMHGMAVHAVEPDNPRGRVPGVGIQFYAVDPDSRARWAAFVHSAERRGGCGARDTEPSEPVRRKYPRYDAEVELELATLDELLTLYTRDVSQGGMFIVTDFPLELGSALRVTVIHPTTRAPFGVDAVVRRACEDPKGIGVEFTGLDQKRRNALWAFVREGVAPEPAEYVPPGDPELA